MFYRRVKSQDEAEGSLLVSGESAAIRERILELRKRLSQLEATEHLPNPALAVAFLGLLIIQGFHEAEQVVQVFQRFVLDIQNAKGLLGQYFDQEPLQFAYNILFFLLLVSVYALSGAHRPQLWSRGTAAWWLLTVGILIQGYHAIEHIFKIWQFVEFGRDGTPGILGNALHLMWLHFALNTAAYLPVIVAYWIGGFYRHLAADLIAGWNQIANHRQAQPESRAHLGCLAGLCSWVWRDSLLRLAERELPQHCVDPIPRQRYRSTKTLRWGQELTSGIRLTGVPTPFKPARPY